MVYVRRQAIAVGRRVVYRNTALAPGNVSAAHAIVVHIKICVSRAVAGISGDGARVAAC